MKLDTLTVTLLGSLPGSLAGAIPSRSWTPNARAVAAPAIPTATLVSDFKKGNTSAQWAPGHPLQWGSEDKKYAIPDGYYGTALSEDEKYITINGNSAIQILSTSDLSSVGSPQPIFKNLTISGSWVDSLFLRPTGNGQYDLLASTEYINNASAYAYETTQIRLSKNMSRIDEPIERTGEFTTFESLYSHTTGPFSQIGRRFIVKDGWDVYIYDLDDPTYKLTLSGHTDSVMSAVFSPNGKYVATAAWDGFGKLWDAATGKLIHDFEPQRRSQSWLARFSPDSKQVIISMGNGANLTVWDVNNLTAAPVVLGPYGDWVRSVEYSPDGKYLATGEYGFIRVYRTDDWSVVQTWQSEDRRNWEIYQLAWLEGGKRLTYRIIGGIEMYDFETNLKYRWGPGDLDHFNYGSGATFVVKSKGWIGGQMGDSTIKFWKYPA